jgi:hypothetical protein
MITTRYLGVVGLASIIISFYIFYPPLYVLDSIMSDYNVTEGYIL